MYSFLDLAGDELQKKEKERAVLQEQVDRQEMSSEDFERMTSERDKLHKQLADLAEATAKASNASWRLELAAGSKQNHVEGQLNEFNTRAHGVHLLPLELPSGDLLHELELAPANPETMLPPGIDIRGAVRPAIQHLRQGEAEKRKQLSDVCLSCQEDLDDLLETLERGRENVAGIEARLDAVKEQLDDANAVSTCYFLRYFSTTLSRTDDNGVYGLFLQTGQQETTNFSAEHSKQESNLHQIEHAGRIAVQQAELRLSQLRIQ